MNPHRSALLTTHLVGSFRQMFSKIRLCGIKADTISQIFAKLKLATKEHENACGKWGAEVNSSKCKVMTNKNANIVTDGVAVENFFIIGCLNDI